MCSTQNQYPPASCYWERVQTLKVICNKYSPITATTQVKINRTYVNHSTINTISDSKVGE